MKKNILLGFVFLSQLSLTIAQTNQPVSLENLSLSAPKTSTAANAKAIGQPFYYDNFDSTVVGFGLGTSLGASNWVLDQSGQTGPTFGWTIDNVKDGWWANAAAIASTSEGKFAELSNGNPTLAQPSQALDVIYTMTTANPINIQTLAGTDQVSLSFEQFGARFNDLQAIQISTDGTTWVTVGDNLDKSVLSATGGAAYANPDLKSINLAPFIAGNATSVSIRFMWTTNFPNSATNPNVWVAYGWYIDDLILTTNPDDEVSVNEVFIGDIVNDYAYSVVPVAQTTPFLIGVSMTNNGVNNFTAGAVNVSIKLNGTEVDNFDELVTLNSGIQDTFWITSTYTPSTVGDYTIDISIPADDIVANNTGTSSIKTSDYVWGHDFGGTVNRGFNQDDETAIGNLFLVNNEAVISAINIKFRTGTTVGQEVEVAVYEVPTSIQGTLNFVAEEYYIIQSSDITAPFSVIELTTPGVLEAGKQYLVYVKKTAGTNRLYVSGTDAGDNDNSTACFGPFGTASAINWFNGWGWSPYVRANFDPTLAIKNVSLLDGVSVYPNPTEGLVTISNDNGVENTITVFDITGKKVASKIASTTTTLDLSSMGTGVYMVEVANANGKKSERIIIK